MILDWDEFMYYQRRANKSFAECGHQFNIRNMRLLINASVPCAVDFKQKAHLRWTRDHSGVNWIILSITRVGANEAYEEYGH